MTHSVTHEIECSKCGGTGTVMPARELFDCEACDGVGWREMTPDEEADAAERAYERQMEDYYGRSSPVTLDEQHHTAWQQKQESRK